MDCIALPSPVSGTSLQPEFGLPQIRLFLVGGYHLRAEKAVWTLVARHGGPTTCIVDARLYAFNKVGYQAARHDSDELTKPCLDGQVAFVARVIATGDPDRPSEVTAAWQLEGPEPVNIELYSFQDRPAQ